jgi:hypothetical protein
MIVFACISLYKDAIGLTVGMGTPKIQHTTIMYCHYCTKTAVIRKGTRFQEVASREGFVLQITLV